MRGATQKFELGYFDTLISIHAPHARSDRRSRWLTTSQSAFQSTLLMRGATYALTVRAPGEQISIHAPHARSDAAARDRNAVLHISIHAPHARSDMMSTRSARTSSNFNPRSSCEERRRNLQAASPTRHFNPRSSCEERPGDANAHKMVIYFNPRSSCEERPMRICSPMFSTIFQSTLLMRGAT